MCRPIFPDAPARDLAWTCVSVVRSVVCHEHLLITSAALRVLAFPKLCAIRLHESVNGRRLLSQLYYDEAAKTSPLLRGFDPHQRACARNHTMAELPTMWRFGCSYASRARL